MVGRQLLEEGQDAPLPLWHYGARKQGRVACRQWQVSVYMSHTCVGWLHARLSPESWCTLLTMTLYQALSSPSGFLRVKAGGGSHTHFPPPLKIYVYM